jgi:long-chain acyl-CoA synthetase
MLDPLSLLPLAIAGHRGHVDEFEAQQLVAAGITLLQRSAPLVRALSGKRSAILLPTSPAFFVALAASEGRGAVLINPLAARLEVEYQITDADVGAVFTNRALAQLVPDHVLRVLLDDAPNTAHVVTRDGAREVDLGSHHGLGVEGDPDVPGSTDEAAIVYTSAMHGSPLGAILTHRNLLTNARSTIQGTGMRSDDRVLAALPLAHLFGLTATGTAPLLAGARVITMPRFNPARAAELIVTGDVTLIAGVPSVFGALLAALERHDARSTGALRLCLCGGAPLPVELQDRWFDLTGIELRQGYGLTEAGPVCLFNLLDQPNVRGALGRAIPGVEVRIGSDDEILVRGDNVFAGYVSNGEAGLIVDGDGWLHTGDSGRMNDDGTVSFTGVIKPMFTRNGFNIYPREIAQAVIELAGVDGVRVRRVPNPARENDIALDVRGTVTDDDVRAWCAERLSAYKQPSEITLEPRTTAAS